MMENPPKNGNDSHYLIVVSAIAGVVFALGALALFGFAVLPRGFVSDRLLFLLAGG
jgi:hypothetical protein